jgi:hypothetical protein
MNNLYLKFAVASACTALTFALGANKEAKAATIILTPTTSFGVTDQDRNEQGDSYYSGVPLHVGLRATDESGQRSVEDRAFYEFNIANLFFDSNTVISSAIFQFRVDSLRGSHRYYGMELFGYRGNGQPDASDFSPTIGGGFGVSPPSYIPDFETSIYLGWYAPGQTQMSNFNKSFSVTPFVNKLISENNAFAGFSVLDNGYYIGDATLNHMEASLIITTESVPEPTTIFGSALALGVGGWLKRKRSSQQNKTTPQN